MTTRRFRSLAISLAIVLTIIDLTQGFTIRFRNVTESQDLAAEESTFLEVKNDLRRPNDINTPDKDGHVSVLPTQTITKDVTIKPKADIGLTDADREDTERTLVDKVPTEGTQSITTDVIVQTIGGIKPKDWFETTMALESDIVETRTETSDITSYTNTSPQTVLNSKEEPDNVVLSTAEVQDISSAPFTLNEQDTTPTTPNNEEEKTTEKGTSETELLATISDAIQTLTTETTISTDGLETTPVWKKYTIIQRIRVPSTDTDEKVELTPTERVADSINAHTTESRVSLEQAFDLAPDILSLQQLKNDLMKTTNAIGYRKGLETTTSIDFQTESIPLSTVGRTTEEATLLKATDGANLLEMVSKRAGYLDHTKTTISTDATTTVNVSRDGLIELDVLSDESDPDSFATANKTSQSQLAEDAIKEELLKESIINDKEENSMLYHSPADIQNKSFDVVTPKVTNETVQEANTSKQTNSYDPAIKEVTVDPSDQKATYNSSEQTVSYNSLDRKVTTEYPLEEKVTEDLSVKPISPEKKITNLYAVNPNYKPLKKIDVQPPKSFTRDPDDNSWRNESLSSLGIVFKAKNSSKAFTEVLKNKTETVMNNLPDQNRTIEKIELRDRLEKIAEKRKSKKKKTDQFGNTEYTDYEENNNLADQHSSVETPPEIGPLVPPLPSSSTEAPETTSQIVTSTTSFITNTYSFAGTEKPPKVFNLQEYYDTSDDDDYVTLPKVDIMKATSRPKVQWPVTQSMVDNMKPTHLFPERKPTVQYFPPRAKPTTDVNIMNEYTPPAYSTARMPEKFTPGKTYPVSNEYINYSPNENRNQQPLVQHVQYKPVDVNKNVYLTQAPKLAPESQHGIPESFTRGFAIRHYKDFIDAAVKDNDYDRNAYLFTEPPTPRATANAEKTPVKSEEYDYDVRKEVLDRFVDNFNQNHEQFKVDFPVVFNTSIVHKHGPEGGKVLASSSAMFKRLYNDATATKANGFLFTNKPYDPNCENITVELSPAYELHYYVPDQEEREEQAAKVTLPYGYRL